MSQELGIRLPRWVSCWAQQTQRKLWFVLRPNLSPRSKLVFWSFLLFIRILIRRLKCYNVGPRDFIICRFDCAYLLSTWLIMLQDIIQKLDSGDAKVNTYRKPTYRWKTMQTDILRLWWLINTQYYFKKSSKVYYM